MADRVLSVRISEFADEVLRADAAQSGLTRSQLVKALFTEAYTRPDVKAAAVQRAIAAKKGKQ